MLTFECDACDQEIGFWAKYIGTDEHICHPPFRATFSPIEGKQKPKDDDDGSSVFSSIIDTVGDVVSSIGDSIGDIDIDLD